MFLAFNSYYSQTAVLKIIIVPRIVFVQTSFPPPPPASLSCVEYVKKLTSSSASLVNKHFEENILTFYILVVYLLNSIKPAVKSLFLPLPFHSNVIHNADWEMCSLTLSDGNASRRRNHEPFQI